MPGVFRHHPPLPPRGSSRLLSPAQIASTFIVFRDFGVQGPFSTDFSSDFGPWNGGLPLEVLSSVFRDTINPIEGQLSRLRDAINLAEWRAAQIRDTIAPIEWATQSTIYNAIIPIDWRSTSLADLTVPLEVKASPVRDDVSPVDWSTLRTFYDAVIPVESNLTKLRDAVVPTEILASPFRDNVNPIDWSTVRTIYDAVTLVEWNTVRLRDDTTPSEWFKQIAPTDFIAPTEWKAALQGNYTNPIDWLTQPVTTVPIGIEVPGSPFRDYLAPIEMQSAIFRSDIAPTEWTIQTVAILGNSTIPLEWMGLSAFEAVIPLEWRGSAFAGFIVPIEARATFARDTIIPLDALASLAASQIININWNGVFATDAVTYTDWSSGFFADTRFPIEVLRITRSDTIFLSDSLESRIGASSIPIEFGGNLGVFGDANISVEWRSLFGSSTGISVDFLSTFTADSFSPLANFAAPLRNFPTNVEFFRSLVAGWIAPIDILLTTQGQSAPLFEWSGPLNAVGDALISIEWQAILLPIDTQYTLAFEESVLSDARSAEEVLRTTLGDSVVPSAVLRTNQTDITVPISTPTTNTTDTQSVVGFENSVIGSASLPVEVLRTTLGDLVVPSDVLRSHQNDTTIPTFALATPAPSISVSIDNLATLNPIYVTITDWTGGASAEVSGIAAIDWLATLSPDTVALIETIATGFGISSDTEIVIEFNAVQLADIPVTFEFGGSSGIHRVRLTKGAGVSQPGGVKPLR